TAALVASCTISALFAALPFGKLVIIDILLYSAALSLEFAALLALRWRRPEMPRPFRVPGGWPVLVLMTLTPMSFAVAVVAATFTDPEADPRQAAIVVIAILSGIALYYLRRRKAVRQK
ncbi:MAG: APC family permease, partial [Acidobacteriota bacterium]|nr:APC family permease [Acidobacteriota bacterium]